MKINLKKIFYLFVFANIISFTIWQGYISDRYIMFQDYLKPFLFISLLWTILFILIKLSLLKIARFFLVLLILITLSTYGLYSYLHNLGIHFNGHSIKPILQTNIAEGVSFLNDYIFDWKFLFVSVFLCLLFCFVCEPYIREKHKKFNKKYIAYILLILCIITSFAIFKGIRPVSLFIKISEEYKENLENFNMIAIQENTQISATKKKINTISLTNHQEGELYIIVIGESQNKDFMHIFNTTFSNTSPNLDRINKKNLILLNNAYASITHTVESLTLALTNNEIDNTRDPKDIVTLPSLANKAGFNTYWISNQGKVGLYGTPISALASTTKHQFFLNESDAFPSEPDEVIFPKLEYVLNSLDNTKDNLIIIHLNSNHSEYKDRYPDSFEIQKLNYPSQGIYGKQYGQKGGNRVFNRYTNSIIYNDFIVNSILEKAKKTISFNGLFYFADHGEDPLMGHDFNKHAPLMLRIPVFFYITDKYINKYPDSYKNLIKNKDNIFINEGVFDTAINFLQIDCAYDNKTKSLFNNEFITKPITEYHLVDNVKITEDPYLNLENRVKGANQIFLAHTNSLYKAKFANNFNINNYEVDSIFDNQKGFTLSIKEIQEGDISLKDFIKQSPFINKIWLNISNLNTDNVLSVIDELTNLDNLFSIRNKVIVVSDSISSLQKIQDQKWNCTYLIPWKDLLNQQKKEQTLQQIKQKLEQYKIQGISFDFQVFPIIEELQNHIQNNNLKLYSWDLNNNLGNHDLQQTLAKYEKLEAIVLPLSTPFDYE